MHISCPSLSRRPALTLVEVLVAIFIMSIGMLALLTLFPIGVLRVAEAIQNERSSQCAINAHAISIAQNIRNDISVLNDFDPAPAVNNYVGPDYFKSPVTSRVPLITLPPADDYLPSYPVFVDPIGYSVSNSSWVAGGKIPRRFPQFAPPTTASLRWFSLLDDLIYDNTGNNPSFGIPAFIGPNIMRNTNYTWAYLCQRPQTIDTSVVDCSVVVYKQRPLALGLGFALNEYEFSAYFDAYTKARVGTNNTITIDYSTWAGPVPSTRPGDWILDATVNYQLSTGKLSPHGFFYRVVGVNALSATSVQYEVATPLKGWSNDAWPQDATGILGFQGHVILLDGVVEVFEKGPCRLP